MAVSALWNYFVLELRQSASQNLSKMMELPRQQRSFRKGFVRLIDANSETKKPPARPTWLTDGINGSCLCTLTFSVVDPVYKITSCVRGGMAGSASALHADEVECGSVLVAMR